MYTVYFPVINSPSPLVFSVTTLNNFMFSRENLLFQNLCSPPLIDTGDLEYLSSIYIRVRASAHHSYASYHTFIDKFESTNLYWGVNCIIYLYWSLLSWLFWGALHCACKTKLLLSNTSGGPCVHCQLGVWVLSSSDTWVTNKYLHVSLYMERRSAFNFT